jgi:hypothetical protein
VSTAASTYLLRLRLPDRPGVLGAVATALGSTGADIDSIAVVDQVGGFAVDDLVISLPVGALVDRLVSAASSVPGVVVESVQRHHSRRRMHDDLELLDAAASAPNPVQLLVSGLPELLHASYAFVAAREGDAVRLVASSSAAPSAPMRDGWCPPQVAGEVKAAELWADPGVAGPDCDLVAIGLERGAAIVVGRIGGPAFRPAEMTRLSHLCRIAQALFAAPNPT